MNKGAIELHNLLQQHRGGLHLIVGRVGSGKTAALYSFCELFAPICQANDCKMLAIYSERKPNTEKQVNKGDLAYLFDKKSSPTSNVESIRKRLDSIEGIESEYLKAVKLGEFLDVLEFKEYNIELFIRIIKQVVSKQTYKGIFVDVDLNSLECKSSDNLGIKMRLDKAMSSLSQIVSAANTNLYLVAQARRGLREVEPIINDISTGGTTVVHLANSIFSVCMKTNRKSNLILTTLKNRWGNIGEKYEIPFQWEL